MQATEGETKSSLRSDDSINFRPSPNFKHMKKYLKSKFEEMNSSASNAMPESVCHNEQEKVKTSAAAVQPPLPPNPPPPDSPVSAIKQEIIDDDYQCNNAADSSDANQSEAATQPATEQSETTKPEVTMCRNFVRGTCKKGAACIFVHELILSQLPGVYTFCRNFQNRQCTYAKCKFVHATVFEKEYFFRTGYLPPHTTAHMKQTLQPPPPPPPPPPPEETQQVVQQAFPTTPSFDSSATTTTVPVLTCPTAPAVNGITPEVFRAGLPESTTSPLKREWSDGDEFSRSPRDLDTTEQLAKKCKNCDTNEFRYQYIKNKVEKMILVSEERKQKMALLNRKHQRLCTVLMTLFKPMSPGNNNLLNVNVSGDKEKAILEQKNLMFGANNRLSIFEDSNKTFLSNMNF